MHFRSTIMYSSTSFSYFMKRLYGLRLWPYLSVSVEDYKITPFRKVELYMQRPFSRFMKLLKLALLHYGGSEMHTHQNRILSYKLSLHRKTNIIWNMTKNITFLLPTFIFIVSRCETRSLHIWHIC